jgi:drug/metabolite transporter (DMT)-like permease
MKPAIESQPFYDFLATRFTIAVLVMLLARPSVFKKLDADLLKKGTVLGVILALGYITQTIALEMTTAAITGFLTGLYAVLTPLIGWVLFRDKVGAKVLWGGILATIGLGLISINGFGIGAGEVWGIICAVLYAAHIVGLGAWASSKDAYAFTVVQLAIVGIISWIGALPDGFQAPENWDVWFAIIFSAVFATALGFWVQTWAQAHMEPSRVALILTLEVVFAALFAVWSGQEVLSLRVIIGGALMVAAMLMVEWPTKAKPVPLPQGTYHQ